MKKFQLNKDCFFLSLLFLITFLFFFNLFFPKLQTFVTPDFGQSDVFQLNVPAKFFLAQNLKNNQLPLWNPYIGNGFPTLAEGQTGTFFIINLILFKFLPVALAFNLGIVSIFLTTAVGMYLFCREIKLSPVSSFFSSLTFTFCGFFIGHLTHFNLIQAASLFPLLLFLTLKIIKSVNIRNTCFWGGLFSLTLSQQIFTGFPQMVSITLIWVFLLFFYLVIFKKTINKKVKLLLFISLFIFSFLGFLISGVQLIPQYEFLKISTRSKLSETQASYYSYPLKHLITLVLPYFLGNPKLGTYPPFYEFDGSIFWENTGYIGLIGVTFAILGLFLKFPSKKLLIISLILAFLLMTGKYSPLYFVYEIPPLSLFRVPSRFILPFIFSLAILAGSTLQNIMLFISKFKKKFYILSVITAIIIFIQIFDLYKFTWSYHAIASWQDWLKKPAIAEFVISQTNKQNSNFRVISLDTHQIWNDIFTTKGWNNIEPYNYFRNDLMPNLNILFDIKQFGVYPVQKTKRYAFFESLLLFGVKNGEKQVSINNLTVKLLGITGVNYLISPKEITFPENIQPTYKTPALQNFPSYEIYPLKTTYNTYFASSSLTALTLEEALDLLSSNKFNPPQNVVLEKDFKIKKESNNKSSANISLIESTNIKNVYNVNSDEEGFLVISQTYYPGWRVFVDGVEKEILPANLNFTAVYLTAGNHYVSFIFKPNSLVIGCFLSLTSLVITFLMVFAVPLIFSRRVVGIRSFSAHL